MGHPNSPHTKTRPTTRIFGDYKFTVNSVSKLGNYPILKTEDLLAVLRGGRNSLS